MPKRNGCVYPLGRPRDAKGLEEPAEGAKFFYPVEGGDRYPSGLAIIVVNGVFVPEGRDGKYVRYTIKEHPRFLAGDVHSCELDSFLKKEGIRYKLPL